jgi:hypothetical protein
MNFIYDTDLGYGIRIMKSEGDAARPSGHVVELHFYNRSDAVKFATDFIREVVKRACK